MPRSSSPATSFGICFRRRCFHDDEPTDPPPTPGQRRRRCPAAAVLARRNRLRRGGQARRKETIERGREEGRKRETPKERDPARLHRAGGRHVSSGHLRSETGARQTQRPGRARCDRRRADLDEGQKTLVVVATEFRRSPVARPAPGGTVGREHNAHGFSAILAGGNLRGGRVVGATDAFGYRAQELPINVTDLQATVLERFGLRAGAIRFRHRGESYWPFDPGTREIAQVRNAKL